MGARLHYVTRWTFDAPIDRVWAILSKPELYPRWWPGFEAVRTLSGDGGVGTVTDHRVNVGSGLRLHFVMTLAAQTPPTYARTTVAGDSKGFSEWRLAEANGSAVVEHVWDVEVQRPLLRLAGALPGSAWFFRRRHESAMAQGYRNLVRMVRRQEGGQH